jgi:large subunit ribosomal protein L31e
MVTEKTFTIPLRSEWLKTVKYKRAKKAVRAVREFLARHMKVSFDNVRIGRYLNLELWKHGIKNPPSRVKINATKDDKGFVMAEIFGAPKEAPKEEKTPAKLTTAKTAVSGAKPAELPKAEVSEKTRTPAGKKIVKKTPAKAQPPSPAPKKEIGQIIR